MNHKFRKDKELNAEALFYLGLLAVSFAAQPILTSKYTPIEVNIRSVIFVQELVKLFIATIILNTNDCRKEILSSWKISTWLREAFAPATLYCFYNILCLYANQRLDAIAYNCLNQTKILWSALACYIFLGQKQSVLQVWSLILLLTSAMLMVSSSQQQHPTSISRSRSDNVSQGIVAIFCASILSGVSGTIVQSALQSSPTPEGEPKNPYLYTMELSAATILVLTVSFLITGGAAEVANNNILSNWSLSMMIPITTDAIGGIVVGLVLKHAGLVRKGFASIFGLFLSELFQATYDDISWMQIFSGVLVGISIWIHLLGGPTSPKTGGSRNSELPIQTTPRRRKAQSSFLWLGLLSLGIYAAIYIAVLEKKITLNLSQRTSFEYFKSSNQQQTLIRKYVDFRI